MVRKSAEACDSPGDQHKADSRDDRGDHRDLVGFQPAGEAVDSRRCTVGINRVARYRRLNENELDQRKRDDDRAGRDRRVIASREVTEREKVKRAR